MIFSKRATELGLAISLLTALLQSPAIAQSTKDDTKQTQKTVAETTATTSVAAAVTAQGESEAKGTGATASDVEQLKRKVDDLQSIVERQQLALTELEKQLQAIKAQPAVSASAAGETVKAATGVPDREPVTGAAPPAQSAAAKAQKAPVPLAGWDGNHAFLRSADGSFETFLTGYGQLDFRGYQRGNHPPNTFLIRRARLALEGKLLRYFEFKMEGDFADTTSTLLRDFYVRVHRDDRLQATFGQFKEPFSQEELRSDAVQDFVERSLVNNLAPSRSPGVVVSGAFDKGVFEYQVGAFNGKGLLANNTVGTPEGVARVRFTPWRNTQLLWAKGLSFGGAYALGRNSINGTSVRGQMESRSFTFFSPDTVNGPITRANGELTWLIGPASIRAEYDQTNQERNRLGPLGANLPGVIAKGYMGQFTYLLTGENKTDVGVVTPKRNLFGDEKGKSGYGAWELAARYSNLQIDDRTSKSNRADTIYLGANWYLNRFVRYMLDFGFERYRDPLRTPRPGDKNFFVILSRVQVAF